MKTRAKHRPHTNGRPPAAEAPALVVPAVLLRIDLGCGPNKRQPLPGEVPWVGVDSIAFPGVDVVADLTRRWPWPDSSVAEAHASHFLEHLTNFEDRWERVHFFNELYRVLVPGGKATLIFPHWCSNRYYGDPTHREPFSEMGFYYLKREWRLGDPAKNLPGQAPHADAAHNPNGYACDFDATWGYAMRPDLSARNQEYQQFAMSNYKEACLDLHATLTACK